MKATRSIVPVVVVVTMLVGASLVIGIMTRGEQGKQEATLVDDTPNADLSNDDLVSKALDNMADLKSYGFEVIGIEPAGAVTPTYSITLTGYEKPPGTALMVSARGKTVETNNYSLIGIFADEAAEFPHEMILSKDGTFISGDGGTTWKPFSSNGGYFVPPVVLLCTWGGTDLHLPSCASMVGYFNFKDAEPRTEVIDGVPTRHLVADALTDAKDPSRHIETPMITHGETEAVSIHIWASTDATPLIQRMRIDITNQETMGGGMIAPFTGVAFSPDGKLLAGAHLATGSSESNQTGEDETILVWDLTKADSPPTKPRGLYGADVRSVVFSPDGKMLVATGYRGVYMWDTANLDGDPKTLTIPGKVSLPSIAFRPDNKMLAASGSEDGIYIWGQPFTGVPQLAVPDPANALAFSPDNQTLAISGKGGVRLYSLNNLKAAPAVLGAPEPTPVGQVHYRTDSLAFSPDGQLLAVSADPDGGDATQGQIQVWNLRQTQQPIASFAGGGGTVAFSPDGKLLAVEGGRIWEVAQLLSAGSNASPHKPKDICGNELTFSADSRKLAVACYENMVQVWDVSNFPNVGSPIVFLRDRADANKLTYSVAWSWSRFNEQFPSIAAPGGAPGQTPIPPEPTATLVPTSGPPEAGMPRTGSSAASGEAVVALSMIGGLLLAGLLLRKTRA